LTYIPTQTVFEKVLSGLNSGTKYYYNFKVCNEAGCSYGNQLSFTTQIIVNAPSLKSPPLSKNKTQDVYLLKSFLQDTMMSLLTKQF